ncbi:MAG TPA: hypothetical protein VGV39_13095 [Mesorhizobium sp.]|jgi:hypothetical protein|uniref:hypothetical protein n=1 Tax=Mesorhizobium sp. TaxID=1871066 RepID=UPI002DDCE363|nr:hypothetical protein [Mesorhizobium sp.]HEV2504006.1 hypothetical protein [Mesorhizobium sp.]
MVMRSSIVDCCDAAGFSFLVLECSAVGWAVWAFAGKAITLQNRIGIAVSASHVVFFVSLIRIEPPLMKCMAGGTRRARLAVLNALPIGGGSG